MASFDSYTFDPANEESWFFKNASREDANLILNSEEDKGVFLVRPSTSIPDDFVLCVKEESRNSHYIVNKKTADGKVIYEIGDNKFPDVPSLLLFYKKHYLDTTPLIRPAARKFIGKYKFAGDDQEDLPFEKGEVLSIIRKDEDQWWTARNSRGDEGQIPVPYVEEYTKEAKERIERELQRKTIQSTDTPATTAYREPQSVMPRVTQRKLPALARVTKDRNPCAYDPKALELHVGETVTVLKMNMNGEWEGMLGEKKGLFPFTHVEFIDSPDGDAV